MQDGSEYNFEGFKRVFTLEPDERFLGMVNWSGRIIITTTTRVMMYDPTIDKFQEIKLS